MGGSGGLRPEPATVFGGVPGSRAQADVFELLGVLLGDLGLRPRDPAADDVARLRRFGETIGWAFQVTDDILDVEESSAALGKTAGKDIAQQKATYPAVYGLERSHQIAKELADKAIVELDAYGERAGRLRAIAEFLVLRRA